MNNKAAVTICSINYIAKALVLFDSYKFHNPSDFFYLVIVDRKIDDLKIGRPGLNIIWVEDLKIDNLAQHAFAFDVIEFNTNVKPSALKFLLSKYDAVLYLDPDMKVYSPLTLIFEALKSASLVVTPHSNTPILDGNKPDDLDFLKFGAFNLGFVGVSRCDEGFSFLEWWSERCLHHGFYEPQLGLAVDQKWVNLAPIFFPNMQILHNKGLNVAFWNLHERHITKKHDVWVVNDDTPLGFIHFSSFNPGKPDEVAQKQSRFLPGSRPDFGLLAHEYAKELLENASDLYSKKSYGFDYFDDGTYITPALRRFYAGLRGNVFKDEQNPFSADGPVKRFAKKNRLLVKGNLSAKRHIFSDMGKYSFSIKILLKLMRISLSILGPERYFNLMRYLVHISSLRNQVDMFGKINEKK
ncbi:glycosyl transferase [Glaciimonas immobilis]|uniref:Glycosyl transferase n=1 Tax=Glaciimonas immobilis TaxID=728004 RepID=A0A840RUN9_9BURK|nr:glycosyl transferase [Glaciimonas immobilis]KAF3997447.1 glycosyl transferase [Glaciimonas immobilis]MBB5200882.1 hypothetical protein [Glaciimonas immobilis]